MLTGNMRFRIGFLNKMILQVEKESTRVTMTYDVERVVKWEDAKPEEIMNNFNLMQRLGAMLNKFESEKDNKSNNTKGIKEGSVRKGGKNTGKKPDTKPPTTFNGQKG